MCTISQKINHMTLSSYTQEYTLQSKRKASFLKVSLRQCREPSNGWIIQVSYESWQMKINLIE